MEGINKDIEWPFATRDDLYRERTELKQDINNFRTELKQDINNLKTEVKQEIKDLNIKIWIIIFMIAPICWKEISFYISHLIK